MALLGAIAGEMHVIGSILPPGKGRKICSLWEKYSETMYLVVGPDPSVSSGVTGYKVYYGAQSGTYPVVIDARPQSWGGSPPPRPRNLSFFWQQHRIGD